MIYRKTDKTWPRGGWRHHSNHKITARSATCNLFPQTFVLVWIILLYSSTKRVSLSRDSFTHAAPSPPRSDNPCGCRAKSTDNLVMPATTTRVVATRELFTTKKYHIQTEPVYKIFFSHVDIMSRVIILMYLTR